MTITKLPQLLSDARTLDLIARRAIVLLQPLAPFEHVELLKDVCRDWDDTTHVTLFEGGLFDTSNGLTVAFDWQELGSFMTSYARSVVPKGKGTYLVGAISTNGRCRDQDIVQVTQLSLDADGTGDWTRGLKTLDAAGLAYIAARSSSHSMLKPKFHLHLPLLNYWSGDKAEWRQFYRYAVGVFSTIFGLNMSLDQTPYVYGFDRATDRLGQPFFLSARRTEDAEVPEVRTRAGGALDLEQLLFNSGFERVVGVGMRRRQTTQRAASNATPPSSMSPQGLMQRAFAHAGLLHHVRDDGSAVVACPWADLHTVGSRFDGSSVVFSPTSRGAPGKFWCSHSHCQGRSSAEVFAALPAHAVKYALVEGKVPA